MLVMAVLADGKYAVSGWWVWSFLCLCPREDRICNRSICHGGETPTRCSRSSLGRERVHRWQHLHDRRYGHLPLVWLAGERLALWSWRVSERTGLQERPAVG